MNDGRKIIARRDAVERIARRAGYSKYRAEDLAQDAALQLLANPNLSTQPARYSFIDAVRGGCERVYDARGEFVVPIFEGHFENYAHFIDGQRSDYDLEREQIAKERLLNTISACEILNERTKEIMSLYARQESVGEISKRFGISPSRIGQIVKFSQERIKEKIISDRVSSAIQRRREYQEQRTLSPQIQTRPKAKTEIQRELAEVQEFQGFAIFSFAVPKIPQALFVSF